MSDSLLPHESQHARPPCPSSTPGVYSNSCPLSWWCHPAISSSVVPFSSCPESLPASGSFPMSQLFAWGGQSTGVSALASVLPVNTQDWSPLGWTGLAIFKTVICYELLPETLQFQRSPSFCNNVIISNPNLSLLKKQPSCQLGFWLVTKKICLTLWYFAFTRLPHIVVEQNTTQVLLESASLWL